MSFFNRLPFTATFLFRILGSKNLWKQLRLIKIQMFVTLSYYVNFFFFKTDP